MRVTRCWALSACLLGGGCATPSAVYVVDAGADVPATVDVALDAGSDVPATVDVALDAGADVPASVDVALDASSDVPASVDVVLDAGSDVPASVDVVLDAGSDAPATVDAVRDVPLVCMPGTATCADASTRRVCSADGLTVQSIGCLPAPQAVGACESGVCGLRCDAGFGNCDAQVSNGCEVNTTSSNAHCGACGNACTTGSRCVAGVCATDACAAPASTRCGSDLLTGWRPSEASTCTPLFVARDFSSIAATTALSSCGAAVDFAGAGTNAELPLRSVDPACGSPRPVTVTMVGRLPTNYQRSLGFVLSWASGESVTLNRWVWNSSRESATDVLVSTSGGTLVNYMSSSANTGGARSDRPWGGSVGNDAGWWRITVTVDPAADTVTATFTQPSQASTVYTATYSTPIPDSTLPSLKLITAGPCPGGGLSAQLLSLTANPPLWQ